MIAHSGVVDHLVLGVVASLALGVYGFAWLSSPQRSVTRMAAWAGGVTSVLVATMPTVESAAERSFTGHMVQHLLLIVVAAPLLVVARPVATVRAVVPVSSTAGERGLARWWRASGPLVGVGLFVGVLYVTHLTTIYERALDHRFLHDAEHVAYLGSAVVLWATLRSGRGVTAPMRVGAVFAVIGSTALLGVVLISATEPLVETYARRLGPTDALGDQRAAASLMWIGGMFTTLPLLLLSVWGWAAGEERRAEHGEALEEARWTARPAHERSSR